MSRFHFLLGLTYRLVLLRFFLLPTASSIMIPETYVETQATERGTGDRRLIVEDIAERRDQLEEFSKLVPCILSFFTKYVNEESLVYFLISDDAVNDPDIAISIIRTLQIDIVTSTSTGSGEISQRLQEDTDSTCVILTENVGSFENVSSVVVGLDDPGCNFIVIATTKYADEETFLDDVDAIVQLLWLYRIGRVVVLGMVSDSMALGGSVSFKSDEICAPSYPAVLDTCDGNGWNRYEGIAAPAFDGCVVKLAYFESYPYASADNETGGLIGIEGSVTEKIVRTLGADLASERITWHGNASVAEEMLYQFYNGSRVDVIIGGVLWQNHKDIDFINTYKIGKVVWMIPKISYVSLRGLIDPFDELIWAAIAGALVLGGIVRILLIPEISWLSIYSLIIGVATPRQPSKLASRIQFLAWSIFGLFLTQLYVDALADQLINASDSQMETVGELASSSLMVYGTQNLVDLVNDPEDTDESIRAISERFTILSHEEYFQRLSDLMSGENSSYALLVMLNFSRSESENSQYVHLLSEDVGNFPLAIATWEGFPYWREFNQKILDYFELGFFDYWTRMATPHRSRTEIRKDIDEENSKNEIHFEQFVPAMLLLAIGTVAGFCFLIIEIIGYPSKFLE